MKTRKIIGLWCIVVFLMVVPTHTVIGDVIPLDEKTDPVENTAPVIHVLAVGIDEYRDENFFTLHYAKSDAEKILDSFKQLGKYSLDTQSTLFDQEATREAILTSLYEIANSAGPKDIFVFYFTGFGGLDVIGESPTNVDFYLFPHDVNIERRALDLALSGISSHALASWCRKIPAQNQLIILDTNQSRHAFIAFPENVMPGKNLVILAVNENAVELHQSEHSPDVKGGLLTHALWEILTGKIGSHDEELAVMELAAYLPARVSKLATLNGSDQDIAILTRGNDFVLGQIRQPDQTPPQIRIVQPEDVRGVVRHFRARQVTVRGIAADESDIAEVSINGQKAQFAPRNAQQNDVEFSGKITLNVGENTVIVQATDIYGNAAEKELSITYRREPEFVQGQYHALLIAVEDYEDDGIDLDYPVQDAEKLREVLTSNYTFEQENVTLLKNPDRRALMQTFLDFRRTLAKDDNLLIFYAGHGYWDEDIEQGYWLTREADFNDPTNWLSNSTIQDQIRGLKTQHVLLISDACFSGSLFKERGGQPDKAVQRTYLTPSRRAITSGALETVPDRSVFLQYLLQRLTENQKDYVKALSLYDSLRDPVINNSPRNQTPRYGVILGTGDEGGDFIFIQRIEEDK